MASISYINPYFLAPSPLKPLKSSPRYQNLPRESVTAHSDPEKDPKRPKTTKNGQKSTYVDLCFLYEAILGPLNASFDQRDR